MTITAPAFGTLIFSVDKVQKGQKPKVNSEVKALSGQFDDFYLRQPLAPGKKAPKKSLLFVSPPVLNTDVMKFSLFNGNSPVSVSLAASPPNRVKKGDSDRSRLRDLRVFIRDQYGRLLTAIAEEQAKLVRDPAGPPIHPNVRQEATERIAELQRTQALRYPAMVQQILGVLGKAVSVPEARDRLKALIGEA